MVTTPMADAIAEVDAALEAVAHEITESQRAYVAHRDALMRAQTELVRVRRRLREIDADATPVHDVRPAPRRMTPPPLPTRTPSGVTRVLRGAVHDPVPARVLADEIDRHDRRPR